MTKYRSKPEIVEAIQWSGSNWHEVYAEAGHLLYTKDKNSEIVLRLNRGAGYPEGIARPGDYLCKNENGQFFTMLKDDFESGYEQVDEG